MASSLPSTWNDADQLDGFDLIDKANLLEKPMMITAVRFDTNKAGVSYVYVDAEDVAGNSFTFNDSSTGVRMQIVDFLSRRGLDGAVDSGAVVPMRLVAPRGLRVSTFEITDPKGRLKTARTYYLTTSGQRESTPAEVAPVKPVRATRKRLTPASVVAPTVAAD